MRVMSCRATDRHRKPNANILPTGTITLAMKITDATGYEPWCHRSTTPPMIVLSMDSPS